MYASPSPLALAAEIARVFVIVLAVLRIHPQRPLLYNSRGFVTSDLEPLIVLPYTSVAIDCTPVLSQLCVAQSLDSSGVRHVSDPIKSCRVQKYRLPVAIVDPLLMAHFNRACSVPYFDHAKATLDFVGIYIAALLIFQF